MAIVLTMPNDDEYAGDCYVTKFKPNTPTGGNWAYAVELTPAGEMAYTAA